MKKIIISNFPVGPKFNGGSMTVWGVIKYFLDNNIEIFLILICNEGEKNTARYKECVKILDTYKIDYKIFFYENKKNKLSHKLRNLLNALFFGNPDYFFPHHHKIKKEIETKVRLFSKNQIFCYHFDALSSCYDIENMDLILGDFIHDPRISRRSFVKKNFVFKFFDFIENFAGFRVMKRLTKKGKSISFFSYNYAKQFSKRIKKSNYIKTPIIDGDTFSQKNVNNSDFNFLMVGHLQGTVTISSLIFLEKFIRKFEDYLLENNIKFNVVGGNKLSNINKNLSNKKNIINFCGESFKINYYYKKNNILLVPNETDIGIRVRIITGMSFGAIIATHSSNKKGIPELKNNFNCLIFSNENELIDIIKLLKDRKVDLDKIRINAKKTFYEHFYYKKSVKNILNIIGNDRKN
jgi:hypothetical protein